MTQENRKVTVKWGNLVFDGTADLGLDPAAVIGDTTVESVFVSNKSKSGSCSITLIQSNSTARPPVRSPVDVREWTFDVGNLVRHREANGSITMMDRVAHARLHAARRRGDR